MKLVKRQDFFDDFFSNFFRSDYSDLAKTDIYENDTNYFIDIEMPGVKKENLKVEFNQGYLEIRASLNEENKDEEENNDEGYKYHIRQRRSFECTRRYKLEEGVTEKDIKVKLEDGVLKVQIAKPEESLPVSKTIEIE